MSRRWFTVLLLAFAVPAGACRYSVRDTGFVDLGQDPWRLEVSGPPAFRQLGRQAAAAALLDANVALDDTPPAAPAAAPALRLHGGAGRTLKIPLPRPPPDSVPAMAAWLETVVASPARTQLLRLALESYAVIVLAEGTDSAANQAARAAVDGAAARLRQLLPDMPKPVTVPPAILRLEKERQASEHILLWSLGLDPGPATQPRLAIVYGRGRILGTTLEGPLITRTTLQERLALVGQDCECDLSRAWLKGPVIPGRWDRRLQETAVRTLGFDPENPMVRAEVGRIVLRGEGDRQRSRRASPASTLGYSEGAVDELPADPGAEEESPAVAPSAAQASGTGIAPSRPPSPARPPATTGWQILAAALVASLAAGGWIWWRFPGGGR